MRKLFIIALIFIVSFVFADEDSYSPELQELIIKAKTAYDERNCEKAIELMHQLLLYPEISDKDKVLTYFGLCRCYSLENEADKAFLKTRNR